MCPWAVYINGTSQLRGINVSTLTGTDGLSLPRQIMADSSQFTTGGPDAAISPLRPQWQPGTHKIFFSTRFTQLTGEHLIGDLWSVEADTNNLFNLLPRQSIGSFQIAPDGQYIAIATSQSIQLMKPDISELRVVVEFPFINTASEWAYKPTVVWSPDSAYFSVAIPSAEPLAADAHADIYRISVNGVAQKILTLAGNFVFGLQIPLTLSSDGRFVAYGNVTLNSPETETQSGDIHIIALETQVDTVVAVGGVWTGFGWSPDSGRYLYATFPAGNAFVAETSGAVQPLGETNTQWMNAVWLDSASFYFTGLMNEQPGIFFQRLGEPIQAIAMGWVNYGALEVR